jgi:hypothetical protein
VGDREVASPTVYQAAQGWDGKFVFFLVVFVGFAAVGYTVWSESPVMSVFLMGFFGGGALLFLVVMLRGNLTLRVDSEGLTLGSSPLRREIPGRTVPWSDIEAIVLFEQVIHVNGTNSLSYVGIRRRQGLEPLPGSPRPRALNTSQALIPDIPRDILATSVPVNGWSLDKGQLTQAIEMNAPRVPLEDRRS